MPAIGVHHTATEDSAWDGPAAVAAMPNDDAVLHYCHAWESAEAASAPSRSGDDDADDKKSSYKFPHHRTKGGPANIPACRNGLARLSGASIPDGDRAGVRAHLQAHLDDAHKKDGDAANLGGLRIVDSAAWQRALRIGNLTSQERIREHAARAQKLSSRNDFFRITDATSSNAATLDIYDEIGFWGVTAQDFSAQLKSVTAPSITVHINSPGGDVFDGIAILNALRSHPATVNVVVDGVAASAASFIAMAGDSITMAPNSTMMIHDASGVCMGNAADMESMAGLLDKMSDNIASVYASRAGGTTAQWRDAMRGEQWYTADEAVTAGLADRVSEARHTDESSVKATWNLTFFNYDGRSGAPAPVAATTPSTAFVFDAELFRAAMRSAVSTEGGRQ
jgi:ATP-dependent protease ClpP protease subunit